jgi:hypothetical protein
MKMGPPGKTDGGTNRIFLNILSVQHRPNRQTRAVKRAYITS